MSVSSRPVKVLGLVCLLIVFWHPEQVITGVFFRISGAYRGWYPFSVWFSFRLCGAYANHKSKKNPDDDHHYGHHRYENGASLILGTILFIVGIGMLWSATNKMQQPDDDIPQGTYCCSVGSLSCALLSKSFFSLYAGGSKPVKSTMLVANAACPLWCCLIFGGGYWYYW